MRRCSTVKLSTVHPRACGERGNSDTKLRRMRGSSPRLRGTVPLPVIVFKVFRFIPAPAGNGLVIPTLPLTTPVHPRACGERE